MAGFRLSNSSLSVAVDGRTGVITSLVDRTCNFDFCRSGDARFGMIGGLRIRDMLTGRVYDDFSTESRVKVLQWRHGPAGGRLVLEKYFAGADFVVRLDYHMEPDCFRWDVYLRKTAGPDRQIRLAYLLPLPFMDMWAPMADPFVTIRPEVPLQVRHGLSYGRAVQPQYRSALVPMVTFYGRSRCVAYSIPPDQPMVLVRFMNSADEDHLFLYNSMVYPPDQRPHFKVVYDYLSLRQGRETRYSLLISCHDGKWRQALGWYADKFSLYFQPDPKVRQHEGVYAISTPYDRDPDESHAEGRMAGRAARGVRWMELHGHFPWYGLYVSPGEPWQGHHESGELTYEKVRRYIRLAHKYGIAVHIYYNVVDGQIHYVTREFPESIARDEGGNWIPAFRDCYLMNPDPSGPFGRHCLEQFRKLLETYHEVDGVFFDVYGRHYDIDFAHDDGITMVNNKPAYCIKFAYLRLMEQIEPLLRQKGLVFSANKPEGIETLRGIDYIMADEGLNSERVEAMSYYGLYKPVMVLDGGIGGHAEQTFKTCLRLGMLYNDLDPDRVLSHLDRSGRERAEKALAAYGPLFRFLVGKTWVLSPEPLEMPEHVRGNIFRTPGRDYVITMVSDDRSIFDDLPARNGVEIVVRVPDADRFGQAEVWSAGSTEPQTAEVRRTNGTLVLTVPEHKSATVVRLRRTRP